MHPIVENVAEPGRSKRLLRTPWAATSSEAESRAYLQGRLGVFSKVMFWAFLALLAFMALLYERYPDIEPHLQDVIYVVATVALAVLAAVWRLVLARRQLSIEALYRIDLFYMALSGITFATTALLAHDFFPSSYVCLIYASFTMFVRTLFVPSTTMRTAVVSTVAFVPMSVAAIALGANWNMGLPGPAFAAGGTMLSAVAVVLASYGSNVIYDLRQQARGQQQLGQYTLDRKIGEGGMGAVYRAHHVLLRRPTAVKLLLPDRVGRPDNLERFEREVQHMSQLTHANTVAVFDYGRNHEGVFYYAMEYLDGIDLDRLVKRSGPQPSGRVAHILAQVCGALHEAHARGIVHRDIKPANIILCERGLVPDVAKVVDFGLVKELAGDTGISTQIVMGTAAYIAPEAVTDPSTIGPAVDLYGIGAVGFYLVTGRHVFTGNTSVDLCIQHVTKPPPSPSEVTRNHVAPELEAILMRCLAKAPKDRFASADELAQALRAVPPTPGWNDEEARRWWREWREADDKAIARSNEPTQTITIDLGER